MERGGATGCGTFSTEAGFAAVWLVIATWKKRVKLAQSALIPLATMTGYMESKKNLGVTGCAKKRETKVKGIGRTRRTLITSIFASPFAYGPKIVRAGFAANCAIMWGTVGTRVALKTRL